MNIEEQKILKKQPKSYWMDSTHQSDCPALNEDIKVDIAIIGGGIAGITTAYQLSRHGGKIALLEANHILQGTTGHTTAKITSQHGLIYSQISRQISKEFAKQYADANETAIRTIEKIAKENKIECDLMPQSAYVYTLQDEYIGKIQDEVNIASSLGINATYIEQTPLPFPVKAAIRFDNQAQFHPGKFLHALAEKIIKCGVKIFEQTRIINIEESSCFTLVTDKGTKITAEEVIIATHYPFYNKHGLYFTRLYTDRSYVTAIKAKEKYPGGMYINIEKPSRSLRGQPSDSGELIFVTGESHKTGQGEDTTKHYEALIDFANQIFTVDDIPYRWSTQDCMTLDGIPYVGHYTSDTPNMYIATGYGKWGMTNSIASSIILSELIINGKSPWEDVYNPSRQTIAASAKNFIIQNLNVAKEIIEGKITSAPDDVEIKPGEGKIINVDGERAGAYRDEEGKLHIVNTTCTHMGCELYWNSAERTWDCPCHGSRFSCEGDVIEGPAVKPLDKNYNVNTIKKLIKEDY